jgi:hypothetical protein
MIDHYIQLKNSIQDEVTKKFEGSKYVSKIKEIFEKNFELLTEYFVRCQKHTDTSKYFFNSAKSSVMGILVNGFKVIKEKTQKSNYSTNPSNLVQHTENDLKFMNDEEFIFMINTLSSNIKDFFKNSKKGFGHMKTSSDTVIDQVLYCKSNISDMFLQLNNILISPTNPKYSQKPTHLKEKPFKEKLNLIMDKLDNINELRTSISKDIKFLEQNSNKFYDEAKHIFKRMKLIHSEYSKTNENNDFEDDLMNTNSNFRNTNHNQTNQNRGRINSTSPIKHSTAFNYFSKYKYESIQQFNC